MKIGSIGYNYSHDADFVMDRPRGVGCCLFLLIKTPACFEIAGKEFTVRENSFVLLSPETPCRYQARFEEYTDDWMYFEPDPAELSRLEELSVPMNEIVYLGDIQELSHIMHILAYEHYSADAHHEDIESRYLDILFLKLSRILQSGSSARAGLSAEKSIRFTQLRTRIFTMPETVGDVEDLAKEAGMSKSGFQHLYKKLYGVNVMNDVINGRIERAKRLLSSTTLTVREIAERCGYSNEYNFMRQFKSRTGQTPSGYRRCL